MQTTESEPEFEGTIMNVTYPIGREAVLTCSVRNLGRYKVKTKKQNCMHAHKFLSILLEKKCAQADTLSCAFDTKLFYHFIFLPASKIKKKIIELQRMKIYLKRLWCMHDVNFSFFFFFFSFFGCNIILTHTFNKKRY